MRLSKLHDALDALLKINVTPLLEGHAGIGKTAMVREYTRKKDYNLVEIRLGQLADAGDMIGLAEVTKEGKSKFTEFVMPKIFAQVANSDKPFIIFLDELNRAPKDLIQSVFELVHDGTISSNGFTLKGKGHVICAQNPDIEGYDVLSFADKAFIDRFCKIKVEANTSDWLNYANQTKINSNVVKYITNVPDALNKHKEDFKVQVNYTSRSWERVAMLMDTCKDNSILPELIDGLIGTEQGTAFMSFLEKNKVITGEDVLNKFPELKAELVEAINPVNAKLDLISNINNALLTIFETRNNHNQTNKIEEPALSETERDNFCQYLTILPADMLLSVLDKLLDYRHVFSPPESVVYEPKKFINGFPQTDERVARALLAISNFKSFEEVDNYEI